MTKPYKPLNWTPKQVKIHDLLKSGVSANVIVKEQKVSGTAVLKIKNAMAVGDTPDHQLKHQAGVILQTTPKTKKVTKIKTVTIKNEANTSEGDEGEGSLPKGAEGSNGKKDIPVPVGSGNQVVADLVIVPVRIPITQIMQNARSYLINGLHWPEDTKWEDILDTIIYKYFKSLNPPVVLQGWYVDDKTQQGRAPQPPPDVHPIDPDSEKLAKLATLVTQQIVSLAKAGQLGAVSGG